MNKFSQRLEGYTFICFWNECQTSCTQWITVLKSQKIVTVQTDVLYLVSYFRKELWLFSHHFQPGSKKNNLLFLKAKLRASYFVLIMWALRQGTWIHRKEVKTKASLQAIPTTSIPPRQSKGFQCRREQGPEAAHCRFQTGQGEIMVKMPRWCGQWGKRG